MTAVESRAATEQYLEELMPEVVSFESDVASHPPERFHDLETRISGIAAE